ncbi:MAG TPA: hypothetical protein PKA05_19175 [Roseiflexaceae bacterium]|nr:hypothetical protein [Roseiflexaceae bacterium]HMP42510.1 hypothetical protein [Roseiflexaceae bacterium]
MKVFFRVLIVAVLAGIAFALYRAIRQYREDSVFDLSGAGNGSSSDAARSRSISPELLAILADPGDKGPVELVTDGDGREWLVNRRNGFRYPVEDGIPIMLLEEGEKHRDSTLIAQ